MGVMRVRVSQIMNGGRFHLGVLVGPAFEACEHVPTRAAESCGSGHGTPSAYIQPNVTRPGASATVWGVCQTSLAAWVSTLGYDMLKPEGNEVVATEARACNLKLAHGVWEWNEGDGSMGILVLMPGLIISLVEFFSPIEVFQPNPTLGVALTTIRRVEVY